MLGLTGCGAADVRSAAAAEVVRVFGAALAAGDGVTACAQLAPAAVQSLDDGEQVCAGSIGAAGVPAVGEVVSAAVFGDAAQVRTGGDVVFLTVLGPRWVITAAGCAPRPDDRPYICVIEGD